MIDPHSFGAVADGTPHPLSEFYSTLTQAQAVYPSATSLTQEIDRQAIIKALATVAAQTTVHSGEWSRAPAIGLSSGGYMCDGPLEYNAGSLTVKGDGRHSSSLIWTAPGGIIVTQPRSRDFLSLKHFDMKAQVADAGTGISLTAQNVPSNNGQNVSIKDVELWSDFGSSYWSKGIYLNNCWDYDVDDCRWKGGSASDGSNWRTFIEIAGRSIGGRVKGATAHGCDSFVHVTSQEAEGLQVMGSTAVAVKYGIRKGAGSTRPPWYDICHNHISASINAIAIQSVSSLFLSDNELFHGPQADAQTPPNSSAVYINDASIINAHKNQISGRVSPVTPVKYGLVYGPNTQRISSKDNYLEQFTVGTWAQSGSGPGFIRDHIYWGCGTDAINQGSCVMS